jgi:predicted secreted protein
MAGEFVGRDFVLSKGSTAGVGGTALAGCKTKSFKVNNTVIDISNDDSDVWITTLDEPATKSVEISASGVVKDIIMLQAALSATDIQEEYTLAWPTSHKLYGKFNITSFSQTGETAAGATFEVTLTSSGAITVS